MNKKNLLGIIGVIVVLGIVILVYKKYTDFSMQHTDTGVQGDPTLIQLGSGTQVQNTNNQPPPSPVQEVVTVTGTVVSIAGSSMVIESDVRDPAMPTKGAMITVQLNKNTNQPQGALVPGARVKVTGTLTEKGILAQTILAVPTK